MSHGKRILSALLSLCLLISGVVWPPISIRAADNATDSGYVTLEGVHLNYDTTLTDNKNGTYTLTVTAESGMAMEEINKHTHIAHNSFYTVEKDGTYLVELWGGNGADASTAETPAGKGGLGGYVYGLVELKKGEVLYFSLGSHGHKTVSGSEGGGANGSGGAHGGSGSTAIGAGGGYSAVFLFDGAEFATKYLNSAGRLKVDAITESDRISKYIMIAGGGGGGGAYSSDKNGLPHGGDGGSIGHASGQLSGSAYDVEGTFFAGQDGKSSGTSTAYVGKGGTNVPGAVVDTVLSWTDGSQPNDWKGTYTSTTAGGGGGAGNLRGGSGGAGFCGGSGGLMTGFIIPTNVGGGGGGSSFLSDLFTYTLTDEEKAMLTPANPSSTGGAVCITYMEETDLSYLEDLTFSASSTKYFSLRSATYQNSANPSEIVNFEIGSAGDEIVLSGASVTMGTTATLTFVFEPLYDFAGGNNVPLIENNLIHVSSRNGAHGAGNIRLDNSCGFVNVPLNVTVYAQNHNTNHAGHEHNVTDLYVDNYAAVRNTLSAHWQYDFIESISPYTVTDLKGTPLSGVVAPTETTKYLVLLTATPKSTALTGVAAVGTPVTTTTFTDYVYVTIEGSQITLLNGNWVTHTKSLSYDKTTGRYRLSLNVTSDTNLEITDLKQPDDFNYTGSGASSSKVQTTEIEYSGYYYFQLWGGNGGEGGDGGIGSGGAAGGKGGYAAGYVYLKAGDIIHVHIGANGAPGDNAGNWYSGGSGGMGGEASAIALMKKIQVEEEGVTKDKLVVDRYILIAGGGGGGSGGMLGSSTKGADSTVTSNTYKGTQPPDLESMMAAYNGKNGANGTYNAKAAAAGEIYKAADIMGVQPSDHPLRDDVDLGQFKANDYTATQGGAFHLTYLQLNPVADKDRAPLLEKYILNTTISKYFLLNNVEIVDHNNSDAPLDPHSYTVTTLSDPDVHRISINQITPTATKTSVGSQAIDAVDFTIHLDVVPNPEFLGGNDVPVIDVSDRTNLPTGMRLGQHFSQTVDGVEHTYDDHFDIEENSRTDYANVPLNLGTMEDLIVDELFTVRNKVHFVDESEGVRKDKLYTLNEDSMNALRDAMPTDWRADYVRLVDPELEESDEILAPEVTTTYHVHAGVAPKTVANYAVVAEEATGILISKPFTVYAAHRVNLTLGAGLTTDAPEVLDYDPLYSQGAGHYIAPVGEDYGITLGVQPGAYSLPKTITVKVGDTTLIDGEGYTYDQFTGAIHIPSGHITDELTIIAETAKVAYTLHYLVQDWTGGAPGSTHTDHTQSYYAGDPITENEYQSYTPDSLPTGYTFVWNFGEGLTAPPEIMPARDWWIVGTYEPISYTVRVDYYYEGEATPFDSQSTTLPYGTTYTLTSPEAAGYLADTTVVSGTVTGEEIITVTYRKIQGIKVIYIRTDTGEQVRMEEYAAADYAPGAPYALPLTPLNGYTPDKTTLTGTMPTDGSGVTAYVYYSPNTYTLHLDPAGGEMSAGDRTVVYGMPYHYTGTAYEALPTPIKVGYTFLGWYHGDTLVDEDSVVDTVAENGTTLTLTARWEGMSFDVTLRFVDTDGNPLREDQTFAVAYGTAYAYRAADYHTQDGWTPAPTEYAGQMPAQNQLFVFTYYKDTVADTIAVDLAWGDLSFDVTFGLWDPDTLTYGEDSFTPAQPNGNRLTLTNRSTIDVEAQLTYVPTAEFAGVDGYFTDENDPADRKKNVYALSKDAGAEAYLWLKGDLPGGLGAGSHPCGTITVTITPTP